MDKQEFWNIINHGVLKSFNVDSVKNKEIIEKLATYTADEIIEFEKIFRRLVIEANDFKVMAANKIIDGWVGDDPYLYFRCWLIGQGEKTFTETLKNPDYLADVVNKRTDASFEDLMYVSTIAFQQSTGKEEEDDSFPRCIAYNAGLDYDFTAPPPTGIDWTVEELPKLYPKLWAKCN
jgi:hypothetical protein